MRLLLLGSLTLAPRLGVACECLPDVAVFAPGGEIVGRRPVFFVDTADLGAVAVRVTEGDGQAVPIEVEPYGAHVLRVRVKRRLPPGAELHVQVNASTATITEASDEQSFVVHRAQPPPPGTAPQVWRDRNTSLCGTTETLWAAWPGSAPGAWAIWLSDGDAVPAAHTPPLMVSRVAIQADTSILSAEIESCWGSDVALPTPPWQEGSSTVTLRRIRLDGGLDSTWTLPLPAPPVETSSGIH